MWVGKIKFTLVSPLLQVDIEGVGRTPIGEILYHQPTSSKTGMHHAKLIAALAGPHVWLPINLKSYFVPIDLNYVTKDPNGNRARSRMDKGGNPPTTIIPIGGVAGRIPKRLTDSAHNWLDSILAPSHSENALAHWLLN